MEHPLSESRANTKTSKSEKRSIKSNIKKHGLTDGVQGAKKIPAGRTQTGTI
jgi:hypothetical protein